MKSLKFYLIEGQLYQFLMMFGKYNVTCTQFEIIFKDKYIKYHIDVDAMNVSNQAVLIP